MFIMLGCIAPVFFTMLVAWVFRIGWHLGRSEAFREVKANAVMDAAVDKAISQVVRFDDGRVDRFYVPSREGMN